MSQSDDLSILEVVVPPVKRFLIRTGRNEYTDIIGYEQITIDFCERSYVKDERVHRTSMPQITYIVKMNSEQKSKLSNLFRNPSGAPSVLHTTFSELKVSEEYRFIVEVTAAPSVLTGGSARQWFARPRYDLNNIKVVFQPEMSDINLFAPVVEEYPKYIEEFNNRFELMEIYDEKI